MCSAPARLPQLNGCAGHVPLALSPVGAAQAVAAPEPAPAKRCTSACGTPDGQMRRVCALPYASYARSGTTAAIMTTRSLTEGINSRADLAGKAVGTWTDYLEKLAKDGIPAIGYKWWAGVGLGRAVCMLCALGACELRQPVQRASFAS